MDYKYSSFFEDAQDRIEALQEQIEEAIVKIDPNMKRKWNKRWKYILKTLTPIVKDVLSGENSDGDLEKMVEHVTQTIKRDAGKLKLEPYCLTDSILPYDCASFVTLNLREKGHHAEFAREYKYPGAGQVRDLI